MKPINFQSTILTLRAKVGSLLTILALLLIGVVPLSALAARMGEDTTPPTLISSTPNNSSTSSTTQGNVTLTSVTPADQVTDVPIETALVFQFSAAVSVYEDSFTLACPAGTEIPFTLDGYGVLNSIVTLTPAANLPAGVTCTWQTNGAAIYDAADEVTNLQASGTFTTKAGGNVTLTSVTPADQATDVPIEIALVFQFSDNVVVFNDSFTLTCPAGTEIPFTVDGEGLLKSTVTLVPAANLPAGVTCTWQTNGAEIYDTDHEVTNLQASGTFTTEAGSTNPNPNPKDSNIERIEVNQALGVQLNNELNFVAGKPTVIRAFLKEAMTINPQQTNVKVLRDGTTVTTLQPKNTDRPESVVDFLCPNLEACGGWAAGKYVFEVTVNGTMRSTQGTIYDFKKRKGMRILAVPVRVKYGTEVKVVTDNRWKTAYQFISKVYPIAPADITWIVGDELDATAHNVNSDEGQRGVWQLLANLQPKNCLKPGQAGPGTPCFDKILGFIPTNPVSNGQALAGYTYGAPANVVVSTDEDMVATVAHEIGHNYKLGDTYNNGQFNCGLNPAPDDFRGKDFNTQEPLPNGCQAGKTKGQGDGTNIPDTHNPYDVTDRGKLPSMTSYMGSSGAPSIFWTTQEAYRVIFQGLAPTEAAPEIARNAFAPVRVIDFFGYISQDDQVELAPSFIDTSQTRIRSTTGEYTAVAVDASGSVLTSLALNITFEREVVRESGREYVTLAEVPFDGVMEFPTGAAKLQIRKNDTVLTEVSVSANAPTVQVTAPTVGQLLDGEFTIQWTASDADGDDLSYIVEYNPDVTNPESDWYVLAADITETSWVDDFSFLPGGDNAQIIVTASDGVLSSEAASAQFKVSVQEPDVYIFEPEGGYAYAVGDDVKLEADAYDPQLAQFIPDAQIAWRSDIDGNLGTGTIFIAKGLSEGTHTVTVEATDSNGAKVTDQIELYVGNVSSQYIPLTTTSEITVENNFLGRHVQLTIPATLSVNDAYVDLLAYQTPISETPPTGFLFADRFFAIFLDELVNEEWQAITTSDAGVMLTVSYGDLPNNIKPETLRIHRFDEATESWIDAATECTPNSTYDRSTPGKISVQLCHFSEYALTGAPTGNSFIYLPLIQR